MRMQKADRIGMNPMKNLALALGFALLPVVTTTSVRAQSYTVLYNFDLYGPVETSAGFVADPAGNIYGTSQQGGYYESYGTVYELQAPYYSFPTVLYSFTGGADGSTPQGP